MQEQKSLVLILARDLADKLASAMFVVDREGSLVYFNEPAEGILGRSFADLGPMRMHEWATAFGPIEVDGRPLQLEDLPLVMALRNRQPLHRQLRIKRLDGEFRDIASTAFPLFTRTDEFEGAAAVFWELPAGESPA